ncbi:MAG: hypothetical protein ACJ72X_11680 [Nitrososphaeraceae archaeon]
MHYKQYEPLIIKILQFCYREPALTAVKIQTGKIGRTQSSKCQLNGRQSRLIQTILSTSSIWCQASEHRFGQKI